MCLTTESLVFFLNMLAFEMVASEPGRFVVSATEREAHWVQSATGDRWCTMAPQIDRLERFAALRTR